MNEIKKSIPFLYIYLIKVFNIKYHLFAIQVNLIPLCVFCVVTGVWWMKFVEDAASGTWRRLLNAWRRRSRTWRRLLKLKKIA